MDFSKQLLIPRETGKRREKPEEDVALLNQIEEANPAAGVQYLEYLVLRRRSNVCLLPSPAPLVRMRKHYFLSVKGATYKASNSVYRPGAWVFEGRCGGVEVMESERSAFSPLLFSFSG